MQRKVLELITMMNNYRDKLKLLKEQSFNQKALVTRNWYNDFHNSLKDILNIEYKGLIITYLKSENDYELIPEYVTLFEMLRLINKLKDINYSKLSETDASILLKLMNILRCISKKYQLDEDIEIDKNKLDLESLNFDLNILDKNYATMSLNLENKLNSIYSIIFELRNSCTNVHSFDNLLFNKSVSSADFLDIKTTVSNINYALNNYTVAEYLLNIKLYNEHLIEKYIA